MLKSHWKTLASIVVAGSLVSSATFADTVSLPPSFGLVQLSSLDTHSNGDDTWSPAITASVSDGTVSSATVSLANHSSPFIQAPYVAASVTDPQFVSTGQPFATLTYYFEVSGPSNVTIPVNAAGIISASSNLNSANAFVEVYSNTTAAKIATVTACTFSAGCTGYNSYLAPVSQVFTPMTPGFNGTANYGVDFDVESNTVYEILLGAAADVKSSSADATGASYVSAPTLTISQDFVAAGYDIDLSAGIASAVPEPSTWAMMILGFFGIGFMAYRRKQSGAALSVA
jgi:PEP-CTERM motif